MAIREPTRAERTGSYADHHLTVFKKKWGGWNDSRGLCVISGAGLPPAPLTGDAGRGCGDASRALLFIFKPLLF
jgi:hypothetical protein